MKKFQELKSIITNAENDAIKFYEKGNKAAGVRLRKAFQKIKGIAQEGRLEVTKLKVAK
jgi:hypothetical protein